MHTGHTRGVRTFASGAGSLRRPAPARTPKKEKPIAPPPSPRHYLDEIEERNDKLAEERAAQQEGRT